MRNRVEDNHESAGGFLEPPFILRHDIDTAAAMLPVLLVLRHQRADQREKKNIHRLTLFGENQTEFGNVVTSVVM